MGESDLSLAIQYAKTGHKGKAKRLLESILKDDPKNITAWLWMSDVIEGDERRKKCLVNVLSLDPRNEIALIGLKILDREAVDQLGRLPSKRSFNKDKGQSTPTSKYLEDRNNKEQVRYSSHLPRPSRNNKGRIEGKTVLILVLLLLLIFTVLAGSLIIIRFSNVTSSNPPNEQIGIVENTPTHDVLFLEEEAYKARLLQLLVRYTDAIHEWNNTADLYLIDPAVFSGSMLLHTELILDTLEEYKKTNVPKKYVTAHNDIVKGTEYFSEAFNEMRLSFAGGPTWDDEKNSKNMDIGDEFFNKGMNAIFGDDWGTANE